jgi:hypothetical protein
MELIGKNRQALIHPCVSIGLVNKIYQVVAQVGWNTGSPVLVALLVLPV